MMAINRASMLETYGRDLFSNNIREWPRFVWVARLPDKSVIGYVLGTLQNTGEILVLSLAVLRKYRKGGVAMALMKQLHQEIDQLDVKRTVLHVRASNYGAQKLYFKLGYALEQVIDNYYDTEDAFFMARYN